MTYKDTALYVSSPPCTTIKLSDSETIQILKEKRRALATCARVQTPHVQTQLHRHTDTHAGTDTHAKILTFPLCYFLRLQTYAHTHMHTKIHVCFFFKKNTHSHTYIVTKQRHVLALCSCLRLLAWLLINKHTHIHTHICTYTHAHTHTHVHTNKHTLTHT